MKSSVRQVAGAFVFGLWLVQWTMAQAPEQLKPDDVLPPPQKLESPRPQIKSSTASVNKPPALPPLFMPYTMEGPAFGYSNNWLGRLACRWSGGSPCGSMPEATAYAPTSPEVIPSNSVVKSSHDEAVEMPSAPIARPAVNFPRIRSTVAPSVDGSRVAGFWAGLSDRVTTTRRPSSNVAPPVAPSQLRACDRSYRSPAPPAPAEEPTSVKAP